MKETLEEHLKNTGKSTFKRKEILEIAHEIDVPQNDVWKLLRTMNNVSRGYYSFSSEEVVKNTTSLPKETAVLQNVSSVINNDCYIPKKDRTYVKWGNHASLVKIIDSKMFYPVYIQGMSGNGKSLMVEQACAQTKREYIRVQISPETDEDDLIGGFRLINGETVFHKGPVVKAMENGAILLIDEIDRCTNKIMCLQGVLEGKPIMIKKTGEVVNVTNGFNIIATANSKGRGSDDGRYSASAILDDAFLERFVAVIDQDYPAPAQEDRILKLHANKMDVDDPGFIEKLIAWANVIRKTFEADGVDDVISTRRLCHIIKTHSIFDSRLKSINMCVNRFDDDTRQAFLDLYTKIDSDQLNEDGTPKSLDDDNVKPATWTFTRA